MNFLFDTSRVHCLTVVQVSQVVVWFSGDPENLEDRFSEP
jgi:hypothetical protein